MNVMNFLFFFHDNVNNLLPFKTNKLSCKGFLIFLPLFFYNIKLVKGYIYILIIKKVWSCARGMCQQVDGLHAFLMVRWESYGHRKPSSPMMLESLQRPLCEEIVIVPKFLLVWYRLLFLLFQLGSRI